MKLPERTFKVGDRVFTLHYGFCTVTDSDCNEYPITVGKDDFLKDGREYTSSCYRSLFTPEEAKELFGVEETPPKKKVKRYQYLVKSRHNVKPYIPGWLFKDDEEVLDSLVDTDWCERIEESMREFEE